jgi:sulfur-carrier protein adenylyltransferase/sulfurtransferase
MGVLDYFKPVSTWTAQQVREYIDSRASGEFNLVDVRQPGEYESGHLPGARLIPVGQLSDRVSELDPSKPAIVYCAAGVRSRAGASILERAGFIEVHSMAGGINAWQGLVATGFPEAGIPWFAPARTVEEMVAFAWQLEDGTRAFYERMASSLAGQQDEAALFHDLAEDEEHHKEMLANIFRDISGAEEDVHFPALLGPYADERIMEGGMGLEDALAWSVGKTPKDILELSISLEAVSYDRYLAMGERVFSDNSIKLFRSLASQEKLHLTKLTAMFEKLISN